MSPLRRRASMDQKEVPEPEPERHWELPSEPLPCQWQLPLSCPS